MLHKSTQRAETAAGAVVKGVLYASLITLVGAVILGKMVDQNVLRMESVGYGAMIVIGLSSWIAALGVIRGATVDPYLAAAMGSGGYFLVLLIVNALFFGGQYPGFWSGLAITTVCGGIGAFTSGKGSGKKTGKRYKIPK